MPFEPTDEQRAILSHDPSRHAQVLAGPGTGKSTTMVLLLNRLLQERPSMRVRMLTFTRAATGELAEKAATSCPQAERPSTIHSFAISILLRNPGSGGFPEPLRIADTWEFKKVIRPTLAKRSGVNVDKLDKLVREMASNWESLTTQNDPDLVETDRIRFRGAWNEHRRVLGYTLLDELPFALHRALIEHDDLRGIGFDLLLVDEYQDLNSCDLDVIHLLNFKGGCAVIGTGDDDQSIYSWRKAAPVGIRRFAEDYCPADLYSLSVTLRCGRRIIEWANYVIQGDPDRPVDRVVLDPHQNAPDGHVALLRFASDRAEAKGIAALVAALLAADCEPRLQPRDIVILMRTDHNRTFSKPIRAELEKNGITCADPSMVVDLLAAQGNRAFLELMRLLADVGDSVAWASLLELTPMVGTTFFDHIYLQAKGRGTTFATALMDGCRADFKDAPRSAPRAAAMIEDVLDWAASIDVPDEHPGCGWGKWMTKMAFEREAPFLPDEDLQSLLLDLDGVAADDQDLARFLGQIEPLGKDLALCRTEGVRIMTMGGSKGLTVRAAILAGVENGVVPRLGCDLSEERRILYVAMTRAKEYLFCTWAARRSGPTARAGSANRGQRQVSHFLEGGPVESQDGVAYLKATEHKRVLP